MEGRKLWVVALLSCLFLAGASIVMFRTVSANKAAGSPGSAPAPQQSPASMTLHVSGNYPQLKFNSSADLPESVGSALSDQRPVSLLKADLNGDGYPDVLALYAAPGHSVISVRLNTRDQVLLDPVMVPIGSLEATSFVSGDFNVDGNEDLAVAGRDGSILFLYGDGRGGFTTGPTIQTGGSISGLAAQDIDRDGLRDLLVLDQASAKLKIYINQGDFSQVKPHSIDLSSLGNLQAIQTADFNVDHFVDVAVAGDKGVAVLFGDGTGRLSKPHVIGSVGAVTGMVVADFNGDYIPDIAVAGSNAVTVFNSRRSGKFAAGKSYSAGNGITAMVSGAFNSDRFTDIAVADSADNVSVLLNQAGKSFSDPMQMNVDGGAVALLTGFDKRVGIDSIAAARKAGGITVAAASGGTVTVTTQLDENDCPFCDVAGLEAFLNAPSGHPGGTDGISLREAITAINNDSVLHGSSNWTISFAGIGQAANAAHGPQGPFHCQHLHQGTTWLCIIGADAMGVPNGFGDLPPIDSPGTTIDGSLVDHTANGVNNPDGPQTIIRGNNTTRLLVLTSNAANSTLKNLNLANSLGDAVVVQGSGDTIQNCVIGLDCDSSSTQGPLNDGNGGAGINFQSGSVNETVTNNIIGNNGTGIIINGVSQSTAIPQANTFTNNIIGLGKDLRHLDLPPLSNTVCSFCGTYTPSPRGNANDGILLQNGAVGNTIQNNTISNNGAADAVVTGLQTGPQAGNGIEIQGDITSDAIIMNNKIGTDPAGVAILDAVNNPIGNLGDGVFIGSVGNPKFNQVGSASLPNVISGNGTAMAAEAAPRRQKAGVIKPQVALPTGGVAIGAGDFNAQFNVVTGNKIGTNVNGSVQLPNVNFGLFLLLDANNNTIGGSASTSANVISGNGLTMNPGPGVLIQDAADNNLIQNNLIGPNALGTGAPTDLNNPSNPVSNKGGGMIVTGGSFANRIIGNTIAFNSSAATASGILCNTSGSFNTFSQNLIFLNPPNNPPTVPAIQEPGTGQQGLLNTEISAANPPAQTSLIKIDSGTTVTSTGDTTITGTADFNDNAVVGANINNSKVEIFVSQRGSASTELLSEAQAFLGTVTSFQVDPHVLSGNVVDWSAHFTIPAPFLNPVQTPVLFLTATITTGDGSTSPLSRGFVPEFVSSGGGGGCSLAASPTVVNFNNAPVSHTTTQNLVITNTGSSSVTISAVTLTQTGSLFALGTLSLPATIAPTSTFTVPVSFTPTSTAGASASITVANTCTTLTVPVAGTGTTSSISVIPTSLNFGNVNVGQTATQSFTVINFGSGSLNVTGLTIANSGTTKFTIIQNPAPTTVGGQSTLTVFVQFAPTSPGQVTDTLTVASSDVVHPSVAVTLTGTGVSTTPPSVLVNQPAGGQVVAAGSTFTVGFAATGGSLPGTFLAKLSTDGGVTFPFSLGGGTATSGINTFTATAPGSVSTASAVVQVSVTDSASLTGVGLSNTFTIGTPPTITSLRIKSGGKIKVTGVGIQDGAVAVIGNESWPLVDAGGGLFVVKALVPGSLGDLVGSVVAHGATVTVTIRNPGGLSASASATRP